MDYKIRTGSVVGAGGTIFIKESKINFGSTSITEETLPNPAELFFWCFCLLYSQKCRAIFATYAFQLGKELSSCRSYQARETTKNR